MFCPNCGGGLKEGSKFCPACGTGIGVDVPKKVPSQTQVPKKYVWVKYVPIIIICIAVVLLGFITYFQANSYSKERPIDLSYTVGSGPVKSKEGFKQGFTFGMSLKVIMQPNMTLSEVDSSFLDINYIRKKANARQNYVVQGEFKSKANREYLFAMWNNEFRLFLVSHKP